MPNDVGAHAYSKHNRVLRWIVGNGQGLVLIGAEPGDAAVKTSADVAGVAVESFVFAICTADELGGGKFYSGGLVAGYASVGDCDAPQHGGFEICGAWDGIDVASFEFDFVRDSRVGGLALCDGQTC